MNIRKLLNKFKWDKLVTLINSPSVKSDSPSKTNHFLDSIALAALVKQYFKDPEIRKDFPFLLRTPIVDCTDDEAKMESRVFLADIFSNDEDPQLYESGAYEYKRTVPTIKIGQRVGEGMLRRIYKAKTHPEYTQLIEHYRIQLAKNLVRGLCHRINVLICGALLNNSYDRLGVHVSSWNSPSDLHISHDWKIDHRIQSVRDLMHHAADTYEETYDHMMLSTEAFSALADEISTDEKKQRDYVLFDKHHPDHQRVVTLIKANLAHELQLCSIELYDEEHWERNNSGISERKRVLPKDRILLVCSSDFHDNRAIDFANTETIEALASLILETGHFNSLTFGPEGYFTGNLELNPPDIIAWATIRGIPRKHRETLSASLKVDLPVRVFETNSADVSQ